MFAIPLKIISRYQAPKYSFSIFNKIFNNKQSQQSSSSKAQTSNKQTPPPPPKQQPKPKKPSQKQEQEQYDLFTRQKQTLRNIDYVKLKQISKQIPENLGESSGLQEVLFWADGVESPDEIFKLVESFNQRWTADKALEMVENYKFKQFCEKVIKFSYLAKDFSTISKIAEFGVLYDVRQEELWNKLEEKLLTLLKNDLDLEILCQILLKFVKMRQGDMIYYKIQDLAEANLNALTPASTSKILFSMFERQTGDIKTIKVYLNHFLSRLDVATPQDVILFSTFLPYIKIQNKNQVLSQFETKILKQNILDKLDLIELAVITRSFQNQHGSDEFWKIVQNKILTKSSLSLLQAQQIIYGPLNSYRLTVDNAKKIIDMVLVHANNLKATHLSQLSKVIYIYQLDNQEIYQRIEGLIMEELQDLEITPLEELMNICKNYSVTRHGSRDIYKLLEVVIMARMEEIKLNRKVFVGIYNIYNKSDLCSVEMIKEFTKYR